MSKPPTPNPYQPPQTDSHPVSSRPVPALIAVVCCFLLSAAFFAGFVLGVVEAFKADEDLGQPMLLLQFFRGLNAGILLILGFHILRGRRARADRMALIFLAVVIFGIAMLTILRGR